MNRNLLFFSFIALLLTLLALPAFAENDSVMDVHVYHPIAIPGKILQPGNYVFRLASSVTRPTDVEVMSADGKTFDGVFPVYQAFRESYNGSKIRTVGPDASGLTRIKSWYFPGEQYGYRFIYSRSDLHNLDVVAQQMKPGVTVG